MEGVMPVPGLGQGSVGGAGGAEADMQTIGTTGRDQAYASFDAAQGQATEEGIELGDDSLGEEGIFVGRHTDDKIMAGPFANLNDAKREMSLTSWYDPRAYYIDVGSDENGYFVDPEGKSIARGDVMEKSTSEKQARFMAAAAHNPDFAKKVGIKQDVAKEFNKADTGTKQLSKAMKTESVPAVASCQQTNPATADVACAMESDMSDTNYEQFKSRFDDLMNSYVEPEEAFDVVGREMSEMGIEGEEYDAIMSRIEDEFFPEQDGEPAGSFDMSDDADALASAGFGSDEDYGDYGGGEFDEAFDSPMEEAFDLQNGYNDIDNADGQDYFPNGADSPVVRATGPSGARQGDNPEQKKMQIAEVHKELVYSYRSFLGESAKLKK